MRSTSSKDRSSGRCKRPLLARSYRTPVERRTLGFARPADVGTVRAEGGVDPVEKAADVVPDAHRHPRNREGFYRVNDTAAGSE
jgi:hypothetical protein